MRSVRNPAGTIFYSETARGDKCIQLIEFARSLVDGELADLDVIQNFSDAMTVDGEEATVYLATGIADASRIKSPHLTLPDLIRRTPQGRGGSY